MGPLRKGKNSIYKIDVLIRNLHNKEKTFPPKLKPYKLKK